MIALTPLWAALLACQPEATFVTLSATVFSSNDSDDQVPVPGAEVHTLALTGEEVDRVTADADGAFSAQIPSGAAFFVGIEAAGFVSAGFAGVSATTDYDAGDGLLWMRSDEAMETIQGDFAGCAPNDEDGGTIQGWVGVGLDNGEAITAYQVTTAFVTAYDADAVPYDTCYLVDDGEAPVHDPDATVTGQSGRFLVQGSPVGLQTLAVSYWVDESQDWAIDPLYYVIYVPEGGMASFEPLWVPSAE